MNGLLRLETAEYMTDSTTVDFTWPQTRATMLRTLLLATGGLFMLFGSKYIGYDCAGALGCIIYIFVASNGWEPEDKASTVVLSTYIHNKCDNPNEQLHFKTHSHPVPCKAEMVWHCGMANGEGRRLHN